MVHEKYSQEIWNGKDKRLSITNLNGSLHLNKAHATIPSHRKSVMIAKPWNFYTSHRTGLNKHRDNNQRYQIHHLYKPK